MKNQRQQIKLLIGLAVSVGVVLSTLTLYFSFIHDAHPVVEDGQASIIDVSDDVSMLDSAGLYRPLYRIYAEGVIGMSIGSIRLSHIETEYLDNPYVRRGRVSFVMNHVLSIDV